VRVSIRTFVPVKQVNGLYLRCAVDGGRAGALPPPERDPPPPLAGECGESGIVTRFSSVNARTPNLVDQIF
jgi:hypothetical protein